MCCNFFKYYKRKVLQKIFSFLGTYIRIFFSNFANKDLEYIEFYYYFSVYSDQHECNLLFICLFQWVGKPQQIKYRIANILDGYPLISFHFSVFLNDPQICPSTISHLIVQPFTRSLWLFMSCAFQWMKWLKRL